MVAKMSKDAIFSYYYINNLSPYSLTAMPRIYEIVIIYFLNECATFYYLLKKKDYCNHSKIKFKIKFWP